MTITRGTRKLIQQRRLRLCVFEKLWMQAVLKLSFVAFRRLF